MYLPHEMFVFDINVVDEPLSFNSERVASDCGFGGNEGRLQEERLMLGLEFRGY